MKHGWSINKNHWIPPENMPNSKDWKTIPFSSKHDFTLPSCSAIYIVSMNSLYNNTTNLSFKSPIYVGHTINIKERFRTHTSDKLKNSLYNKLKKNLGFRNNTKHLKIEFSYAIVKNIDNIKVYEQYLINIYGPSVNIINSMSGPITKGKPILGTLKNEKTIN